MLIAGLGRLFDAIILHVTDCYAGGVKRHVDDLRSHLGLKSVRHEVVSLSKRPVAGTDHHIRFARSEAWRFPFALRSLAAVVKRCRESYASIVVHGQSTVGYWFAGALLRRGVIAPRELLATPHGHHAMMRPSGALHQIYTHLDRRHVPPGTEVVCISTEEQAIVERLHGNRYSYRVIPNGVPSLSPSGRPRDVDVIVVGRLSWQKDPGYALQIAKLAPNLRFQFVGSGPLKAKLEREAKAAGLTNVGFAGFVPDPTTYYERARCLLSTARYEAGITYTMMEALSHGCRIASTPAPGVKDGLSAIDAIRVPFDNASVAARELVHALSQGGVARLPPAFNIERMMEAYRSLYSARLKV